MSLIAAALPWALAPAIARLAFMLPAFSFSTEWKALPNELPKFCAACSVSDATRILVDVAVLPADLTAGGFTKLAFASLVAVLAGCPVCDIVLSS